MEPKRQISKQPETAGKQPNESATAAAKAPAGRKQPGNEAATSAAQGSPTPQGTPGNQSPTQQGSQGNGQDDLLQHAKEAGGNIVSKVQEQAGSQLSRGKESATNDLTQVVDAVRRLGQSLAGEQNGPIARYAAEYGDKAAQSLEQLTTYIREKDPKQLLKDVQNFGRRRPALLLGGAFLLGFAGARLIKTSIDMQSKESLHLNAPSAAPSTSTRPNAI